MNSLPCLAGSSGDHSGASLARALLVWPSAYSLHARTASATRPHNWPGAAAHRRASLRLLRPHTSKHRRQCVLSRSHISYPYPKIHTAHSGFFAQGHRASLCPALLRTCLTRMPRLKAAPCQLSDEKTCSPDDEDCRCLGNSTRGMLPIGWPGPKPALRDRASIMSPAELDESVNWPPNGKFWRAPCASRRPEPRLKLALGEPREGHVPDRKRMMAHSADAQPQTRMARQAQRRLLINVIPSR